MPAESSPGDGDADETVHRQHADSDDGFVWGSVVHPAPEADTDTAVHTGTTEEPVATKPGADGFEWCVGDTDVDSADTDGETTLDPTLVTERRADGIDDEAVARLIELRRDPTVGRWRRAASELDDDA
jgi:hypothetical protein